MMPPPATINGRSASLSIVSAFSTCAPRRCGLVGSKRLIGVGIELDLRELHIEWQIDQHRTRDARNA